MNIKRLHRRLDLVEMRMCSQDRAIASHKNWITYLLIYVAILAGLLAYKEYKRRA